ncbi:MAG: DDE-type integrase/transposase/recombinase, partial [Ruminococcus sp.]|nr:DDE-type integrase/transposase/recombinase [Ruminococcus sp.]
VQTDNGQEFTKRLGSSEKPTPTSFEKKLAELGIKHKLIKPYTPRHNGKVERSHRKDNEYFYATHTFYSFDDFKKQLAVHSRKYNNFPMCPLNWKSPSDHIKAFLKSGQVF